MLFLDNGFEGTSMDAIAQQAGISKRTLYSHFTNKSALFAAVVEQLCAKVLPDSEYLNPEDASDPSGVLERMAIGFLTGIYAPEQIELYRTVMADAKHFPELGVLMIEGPIRHSHTIIDKYLKDCARRQKIRAGDTGMLASQFLAMLKTDLHMQLLFKVRPQVTPGEIRKIARATVTLFLEGARPR